MTLNCGEKMNESLQIDRYPFAKLQHLSQPLSALGFKILAVIL